MPKRKNKLHPELRCSVKEIIIHGKYMEHNEIYPERPEENKRDYDKGYVVIVYVPYDMNLIYKMPRYIKPCNTCAIVVGCMPYSRSITRPYNILYVFFKTEWEKEGFLLSMKGKTKCVLKDNVQGYTQAWYHKSWKNLNYNPHANDTLAKRCRREIYLKLQPEDQIYRRIKLMTEKGCYKASDTPRYCANANYDCKDCCMLSPEYESYIQRRREIQAKSNKKYACRKSKRNSVRYKKKG